jgi:hypothetical protein
MKLSLISAQLLLSSAGNPHCSSVPLWFFLSPSFLPFKLRTSFEEKAGVESWKLCAFPGSPPQVQCSTSIMFEDGVYFGEANLMKMGAE